MTSSAFRRQQERQKAEREAARREAAREAALERAREERREAEREEARREEARAAARAEAEAERKREERAATVREQRRRARLAALRRAALDARAAEQREAEQRALAQEQAREAERAERREEERLESARARRREAARAEERDEERLAARRAQLRAQASAEEEERGRRERALDDARATARREAEDAARAEERATERREAAQEAARAEAREAELREGALEAARARAEEEQRERERRERASDEAREAALEARRAERREVDRARRRDAERSARRRPPPRAAPQSLTRLQIDGRFIVDETGTRVVLRGVTTRGLERLTESEPLSAVLDEAEAGLIAELGATAVVVPLAQDLALNGSAEAEPEEYLSALDATIAAATSARLYTVLQLAQVSSSLPSAPGGSGDPPVPDRDSIDLWGLLGRRYTDEPGVLFDLFRSPHDPELGDMTAVLMPRLTWPIWIHWLLAMIGELRRWRPDAVVIARGLDNGRDLSHFPLRHADGTLVPRAVYAAGLETVGVDQALPPLALLARRSPVVVAPWLASPVEARAVETVGRRLAGAGLHWFADSWRDPDRPLAASRERRLVLTPLGRAFANALTQPSPTSSTVAPRIGPVRAARP
jgi:hypothetical protein